MDSDSADPNSNLTFRKPSNDVAKRKYRRHSPASGSSSTHGSPERERSSSPIPRSDPSPGKLSEHHLKRKSNERESDVSARNNYGKVGDSRRNYDRHSSRNSHSYSRHDDHRRYQKPFDEGRYSRSSSDYHGVKGASHTDYRRDENEQGRPRDYAPNLDKYAPNLDKVSHDRYESLGYRSKTKEKEPSFSEHQKLKGRDLSPDKFGFGRKKAEQTSEERDRDWHRSVRDGRHRRSSGDLKSDRTVQSEESRGHRNNSSGRHDERYIRESNKDDVKELNGQKEKKKHDTSEAFRDKGRYIGAPLEKNESKSAFVSDSQDFPTKKLKLLSSAEDVNDSRDVNEKRSSSSKFAKETDSKFDVGPAHANASEADLNAAKVAAMKAAELVNKNLVGVGFMSTDQKKKLLWGNKKSSTSEESGHQWDTPLFDDRERQEKFNKLMGLKGEVKMEQKPDNQDGNGGIQAVKQKELQMDLEKQYTAGLRRRDGRTVGLGL